MNKFKTIENIDEIANRIRKNREIKIVVNTPDDKYGIISLYKAKGPKGCIRIGLDSYTPDQFPWQISVGGKRILEKMGYYCGMDIVKGYCKKGEEELFLTNLFEILRSHENMFERLKIRD